MIMCLGRMAQGTTWEGALGMRGLGRALKASQIQGGLRRTARAHQAEDPHKQRQETRPCPPHWVGQEHDRLW